MKLMCDLDGTLMPTYSELNKIHNALFQEEINWNALMDRSSSYWQTKQGQWVLKMFNDDLFFADLLAYKGARETLRIWMRDADNSILYCTSRSPCLEEATAYSLGRNNLPYGDIVFVERDNVIHNKFQIAVMENINVVIDDEAEIVFEMQGICLTLLVTQPYNLKYLYKFRVQDWLGIHRIINQKIGGDQK